MTKRKILRLIKGIIIISIIGGFVWLKKTEKDINQKWKSPKFQKTLREYNSKNRGLFNDNDFNVNLEKDNTLNFSTTIKNPFDEIIEKSKLSLKLVLDYEKGTIKYNNAEHIEDFSTYRNFIFADYDFNDFFKNKNFTKQDLDSLKRKEFLEVSLKAEKEAYLLDEKDLIFTKKEIKNAITQSENSIKKINDLYSKEEMVKLEKGLIEFDNLHKLDFLKENKNDVFKSNHNAYLHVLTDFNKDLKDTTDIKEIPTINLFKVKNATLEVYLEASNTNGFYFNDKVKSINITDKWNDNFVSKKKGKTKEYDISNAIKITIPNTLEKRKSNSDSEIVMSKVKDIFNEEIGVRSQIVFQPKGTNQLNITEISDETRILIKYSKNDSNFNFPNWNEQISEDDKKTLFNSAKKALITFHEKNFPNIELEWLESESGEANNNNYFKTSYLAKQESGVTQTSGYLFWNINESVMITYSTKINDKEKWDKVFLMVLETFDFKNKKQNTFANKELWLKTSKN